MWFMILGPACIALLLLLLFLQVAVISSCPVQVVLHCCCRLLELVSCLVVSDVSPAGQHFATMVSSLFVPWLSCSACCGWLWLFRLSCIADAVDVAAGSSWLIVVQFDVPPPWSTLSKLARVMVALQCTVHCSAVSLLACR